MITPAGVLSSGAGRAAGVPRPKAPPGDAGGATAAPYALTRDDQGRIWFSEAGPTKQLVGFDPKTEKFTVHPVSGTIRHMMFDRKTGSMWFGTDANNLGRLVVRAGPS